MDFLWSQKETHEMFMIHEEHLFPGTGFSLKTESPMRTTKQKHGLGGLLLEKEEKTSKALSLYEKFTKNAQMPF